MPETPFHPSSFCLHTSHRGGQGDPTFDTALAIAVMLEKHGIACDRMHGSDWQEAVGHGKKTLFALPALQERLLEQEGGKTRWNPFITAAGLSANGAAHISPGHRPGFRVRWGSSPERAAQRVFRPFRAGNICVE
jgi:hypothetical protein